MFPIKPLLDRVIVREIPVAEYFRTDKLINADVIEHAGIKVLSDRGIVEAIGNGVQDVKVGDTVMFDEFAQNDPIYLNPADKNRSDLPKFYRIREADLQGVVQTTSDVYILTRKCRECDGDPRECGHTVKDSEKATLIHA